MTIQDFRIESLRRKLNGPPDRCAQDFNFDRSENMSTEYENSYKLDFTGFDFEALENVLLELSPIVEKTKCIELFMVHAIRSDLPDRLDKFDVIVLAVAYLVAVTTDHSTFGCVDVLDYTGQFSAKPMNTTMAYKVLDRLVDRYLIEDIGPSIDPRTGRNSRKFRINTLGKIAFHAEMLSAQVLEAGQAKKAA